jgi:hypothetical protein
MDRVARHADHWMPARTELVRSIRQTVPSVALPRPILHPWLFEHAEAITGVARADLEAVAGYEAFLRFEDGRPTIVRIDEASLATHTLDDTGGEAIAALLARVELDARLTSIAAACSQADEADVSRLRRKLQLVQSLAERRRHPTALLLPEIKAPDAIRVMGRDVPRELLRCSNVYAVLEARCQRIAALAPLAPPLVVWLYDYALLYELVVVLFAQAAHAVADACGVPATVRLPDDARWNARLHAAEERLRAALDQIETDELTALDLSPRMIAVTWWLRVTALVAQRD